jgi:hypothetical protein
MIIALAAALGVAVAVVLLLVAAVRRRARDLVRLRSETKQLSGNLAELSGRVEQADQERRAADVRATAAGVRIRSAELAAGDAERRAGDAERRLAEARRRLEALGSGTEVAVWELERLRMEREWLDVVGPGVEFPVPWNATTGAVVATELAVIREVMGAPSELTLENVGATSRPPASVGLRVAIEMLRRLARSGEEMAVVVAGSSVTVVQAVSAGDEPPDLSGLAAVAAKGGLELSVSVTDGRSEARLRPAPQNA